MTIRLLFRCSRCGSKYFRPSQKVAFKDLLLRKIGIIPQRCYGCRRRFYLYHPAILQSLLRALADPPVEAKAKAAVATNVVWSTFKADPREGRAGN
jgi:hypothetical protein